MYINGIEVRVVPSFPVYAASYCGKLFRIRSGKQMATKVVTQYNYPSVYVRISMDGKAYNRKLHRMIAEAWLGEPPTPRHTDINHKDGNALNNNVDNLEWSTKSENQRHALGMGLKGKGDELYNAALTEAQVHEICKKMIDGATNKDLSKYYNVSRDIIAKLRAGDTYFHIRNLYDIKHEYRFDFGESTIKWICERINEGYGDREIVEVSTNPNLTVIEIKRIRWKIRYKYISDKYF